MKIKTNFSFATVATLVLTALVAVTTLTVANATDKVKVGFVYLTTPGDHGWTYAHEVARLDVEKHFGMHLMAKWVATIVPCCDASQVRSKEKGVENNE